MNKSIALPISYQRPTSFLFVGKIMLALTMTTIGVGLVLSAHFFAVLIGIFLIGAMMAHSIELQHQALHHTGFKNRALNRTVGYLLGLPTLVSYRHYQVSHLRHHRYCGTAKDSEFFVYLNEKQNVDGFGLLQAAFDWRRLKRVSLLIFRSLTGSKPLLDFQASEHTEQSIRNEYRSFAVLLMGVFATTIFLGYFWQLCLLWLVPLLFVAEPLHFFIELPEHLGCDQQSASAFENTRTIRSNVFWFWFTNGNNFHVEHHMYPNLPMERLPQVHEFIRHKIENLNVGYKDFFMQTLGGVK